jgi:hypothetical protein
MKREIPRQVTMLDTIGLLGGAKVAVKLITELSNDLTNALNEWAKRNGLKQAKK